MRLSKGMGLQFARRADESQLKEPHGTHAGKLISMSRLDLPVSVIFLAARNASLDSAHIGARPHTIEFEIPIPFLLNIVSRTVNGEA